LRVCRVVAGVGACCACLVGLCRMMPLGFVLRTRG
jgi:hypothetical protein